MVEKVALLKDKKIKNLKSQNLNTVVTKLVRKR